jgi:spoIIIJ-associated protein
MAACRPDRWCWQQRPEYSEKVSVTDTTNASVAEGIGDSSDGSPTARAGTADQSAAITADHGGIDAAHPDPHADPNGDDSDGDGRDAGAASDVGAASDADAGKDGGDDDGDDDGDDPDAVDGGFVVEDDSEEQGSAPSETDLFRESEVAADYIEGLLDILDYDGDIDELVQNGRPVVEVVGARLQSLVGSRGSTLEALQELSRLAVYRHTGSPSRLLLDVGGFRAARRRELVAVAKNAAENVKQYGEPVRLEPMSAFERKCVHDVINAMAGLASESEGVEPARRVVIRASD